MSTIDAILIGQFIGILVAIPLIYFMHRRDMKRLGLDRKPNRIKD